MNDVALTSAERAEKLEGMGCKRKRVEDIRFVQGKGNYVDDLKLPGMLYGDFTRSPHGHARVKKIDTSKAAALPGVIAVLTAETLKTVNLAWMPTLAGDVQMVLADGTLHVLQEAFREMHGLQCGFCTPGMITRAYRLLEENRNPSEEEIRFGISGNLCRCTGYQNIVKAIQYAAAKMNGVPFGEAAQ